MDGLLLIAKLWDKLVDSCLLARGLIADPVVVTVGESGRISLDLRESFARKVYRGRYEPLTLSFLRAYLTEGDVFFDIGAHVGLYTILAVDQIGDSGEVYAFEPSPIAYRMLLSNIQLNEFSSVTTEKVALSNQVGASQLYTSPLGMGSYNSFLPFSGYPIRKIRETPFECVSVECTTLDDYAQESGVAQIDLLKVDVEGWEVEVLQGGRETLSSVQAPTLIVEFDANLQQMAGSSCDRLQRELVDLGYALYSLDEAEKEPVLIHEDPLQRACYSENIIAAKDVSRLMTRLGDWRLGSRK